MDKQQRKKKQENEKKEKIKKLFQNTVGVTASATAVVVATPLFDNVTAEFNDFKLLEDSIYYEVEVIEEVGEENVPNGLPLRLVIENQWERIEVPLTYGTNENVLRELRPNANYDFTVQMDKGITWVTLVNEQVRTDDELAGVIGPAEFNLTSNSREVKLDLFTQAGGVEIEFYQLSLIQDGQTISQIPVQSGEQSIEFALPLSNDLWQLKLQAITAQSELINLDEKSLIPPGHFETGFSVQLTGLKQALIQTKRDEAAFATQVYQIDIIENGVLIDTIEAEDALSVELDSHQDYTFVYYVNYFDERLGTTEQSILAETSLETPAELFYLLNVIEHEDETEYLLNVENYDTWFSSAFIRVLNTAGDVISEHTMSRVSTVGSSTLLRFKSNTEAFARVEIGLILDQTSQSELIIQRIGD